MFASGVDNVGTWETPEAIFKREAAIFAHLKNQVFFSKLLSANSVDYKPINR